MVASIQGMGSMGAMRPMGQMQGPRQLSSDQKQTVTDLLSNYDAENLTADDAKAIFQSLQEAGIRGPGLREAISEAGFDAEALWSLGHDGQKPPAPPSGGGMGQMGMRPMGGQINSSALQTLQSILSQYDLSNLSDDNQTTLIEQLTQSGLLRSGSMIDLGA